MPETTLTHHPDCPCPQYYLASRVLDDGRVLCLVPLFEERVRITLGPDWSWIKTGW